MSVSRACHVVRLSRAAYYKPGTSWAARDAAAIAAVNSALAECDGRDSGSATTACAIWDIAGITSECIEFIAG
jgi:hypothetical protein